MSTFAKAACLSWRAKYFHYAGLMEKILAEEEEHAEDLVSLLPEARGKAAPVSKTKPLGKTG